GVPAFTRISASSRSPRRVPRLLTRPNRLHRLPGFAALWLPNCAGSRSGNRENKEFVFDVDMNRSVDEPQAHRGRARSTGPWVLGSCAIPQGRGLISLLFQTQQGRGLGAEGDELLIELVRRLHPLDGLVETGERLRLVPE